jgi:uncharacterized damage-inducible protein DinB
MATLVDALVPEFDHESSTTRRLLERVPEAQFDWRPHARSMPLGQLANHLSSVVGWGLTTLTAGGFDLAGTPPPASPASKEALLDGYDEIVRKTRAALVGTNDAELMAPWSLRHGRDVVFTMPRAAVWRSFVLNHLIHHRGQLTVYLRLRDIAVPSIYGPSADEQPQ